MTKALLKTTFFLSLATASQAAQPRAPAPEAAKLRDLPWGQLNFLHTTDTHGWHAGHLQEPSYSADWGDYISFAHHMRKRADKEGIDLLLVDTGDRIEGNGLYDASDPKGKYTFDIFKQQNIDVICSGNHELYKANSSNNEYEITVPNFKGNYLASNLDIRKNSSHGYKPLAPRYKTFKTKNLGIKVLAFGFLYDFQGSDDNTKVIPVQDAIETEWFQEAIRENVDIFLVTGHVAVRSEELDLIYKSIRSQNYDTPILFLGGHTHIRDYKIYDDKAHALESGRYMETIGFASVSGFEAKKQKSLATKASWKFGRRYIDNNLYSYHHHTGLNESTFPTELGQSVTQEITAARTALDLDQVWGCAPRDLWLARATVDSKHSLFRWLLDGVIPDQFSEHGENAHPKLVLTNTGAMRFDIFKGPFTRDTTYLVCPFTSGYRKIPAVDAAVAYKLIDVLNENAPVLQDMDPSLDPSLLMPPTLTSAQLHSSPLNNSETNQINFNKKSKTPGYTTIDDAGEDGDDTIHSRIKYYSIPNCIQAKVDFPSDSDSVEQVDVIFNEYLEPWILLSLQFLGRDYRKDDVFDYLDGRSFTDIIATWIQGNWPCDDKSEL